MKLRKIAILLVLMIFGFLLMRNRILQVSQKNVGNLMPEINQALTNDNYEKIEPMKVTERLSDLAPKFYDKHNAQEEDVTVVLIGDSLSTTNYFTTPREDAKNRPPLMVEHGYVTFIEEQLRWDGQNYYRYDSGLFTESATTAVTKEYDMAWDKTAIDENVSSKVNNRPALTRVLEGTNVSVSFRVPNGVKRSDFIYRTDSLNASSATVSVTPGVLQVFDENSQTWVEANGYSYSAKESDELISGIITVRKSMYQKRLKMKVVGTLDDNTVVTITNNGKGRLTYWGIQTGIRDVMFDFILAARGRHSAQQLEMYEAWDVDYYKPDLILWELPILNHNLDVANFEFTPKNMGDRTAAVFADEFLSKANQLTSKTYSPELISWIMWISSGNYAIDSNNEWIYGICNDGSKVSVPDYIFKTISEFDSNGYKIIDLFGPYMDYAFKRSEAANQPIKDNTLVGSGIKGSSLTIDGGHFNDLGTKVTMQIFDRFFLQ